MEDSQCCGPTKAEEANFYSAVMGTPTPACTTTTANSLNSLTSSYKFNNGGSCPNCGYCPCCGKSNGYKPYYPYYGGLQYYSGSSTSAPNTVYCSNASLGNSASTISMSDLNAVENMLNAKSL